MVGNVVVTVVFVVAVVNVVGIVVVVGSVDHDDRLWLLLL